MEKLQELIETIKKDNKKNFKVFNNERKIAYYNKLKTEYEVTKNEKVKEKIKRVKKELVLNNLFLVIHMARDIDHPEEMSVYDLISIGTIALIRSVDRYRLHEDVKFSTYVATSVIKEAYKEIDKWYGENSQNYGAPIREFIYRAKSKYDEDEIYTEEIVNLIVDKMVEEGLRPGTAPEVKSRLLSHHVEDEELEQLGYYEIDYEKLDEIYFIQKHKEELFSVLLPSEREVIEFAFGFKDGIPHEQTELADIQGISHQAVNQKYVRAIKKMQKVIEPYK